MKKIIIVLVAISCLVQTKAQKKNFTMQEAVLGLSTTLNISNLNQLAFMSTIGDCMAHVDKVDSVDAVIKISLPSGTKKTLFTLPQLNTALAQIITEPLKRMPTLQWVDEDKFYFATKGKYIQVVVKKNVMETILAYTIPEDADNIEPFENYNKIAYTHNNNIYIIEKGKEPQKITTDGTENLIYGKPVHRDEFGITKGLFWNKTGKKLAYYKMDQSMVTDYPIINWLEPIAENTNIKYPFAGQKSHEVTLLIYDIAVGKTIPVITKGPADQYLTMVTWHNQEDNVYVGILNRLQNELSVNKYDAEDGAFIKTIYTEKNNKYVEPQHALMFVNNKTIVQSQKDGFNHLYFINEDKATTTPITSGSWMVNEVLGFNYNNNEIVYTSTQDGPTNKMLYAVDLKTLATRKLSKIIGWHNITTTPNCNYVIDNYSNATLPRAIDVLAVEGTYEKRLLTANNTLTNYNLGTVKDVELKADDNTKLYGKIILPYNFDATKKYPVVVYLYNGPHVQQIKNTFPSSGNLWYDYMTQNGYIMYIMDGRGSSNRGFAFESATHKQLGTIEMNDQLKGVAYLKTLPYVDTTKLGIHGWSFGGFMTTSFMLRYPNTFKVGVAGGPVMDWSKYEIMYTERYMSTPALNKEGFDNSNLLTKTKNLNGKLLLIHGTNDNVVVWQHSLAFIKECVNNNKQVDYFVYPGYEHNVRGKDRVHLMQKITNYFDDYLKD